MEDKKCDFLLALKILFLYSVDALHVNVVTCHTVHIPVHTIEYTALFYASVFFKSIMLFYSHP